MLEAASLVEKPPKSSSADYLLSTKTVEYVKEFQLDFNTGESWVCSPIPRG